MKVGVELKINVKDIDKARLYAGKKGTYLTMTTFIDLDNKDQYDNNGMITHKKEEGEQRAPILGNCKVFWSDANNAPQQANNQAMGRAEPAPQTDNFDDDIPF